jgi:hypothetical protein
LNNITIFKNNSGGNSQNGIKFRYSDLYISNSICRSNGVEITGVSEDSLGTLHVEYSDIQGGLTEINADSLNSGNVFWLNGNIDANPQFVDSLNFVLSLKTGSPCIDTGNPGSPLEADGSVADMGKFFYPYVIDFQADKYFGYDSLTVAFTDYSAGFLYSSSLWSWDFENDGIYDSFEHNPIHTFNSPGIYDVKLKIQKGIWADSLIKENMIVIQENQLMPPANIEISISGNDINLEWDSVATATNYLVYYSGSPNGIYEFLAETSGITNYLHQNALSNFEKLFYRVIAFDGNREKLQQFLQLNRKKSWF